MTRGSPVKGNIVPPEKKVLGIREKFADSEGSIATSANIATIARYRSVDHYNLRVRSVAVLLRPQADAGNLTGVLDLHAPDGGRIVEFHYKVVRAWQQPLDPLLAGSLGTLPMAPLADVSRKDVPQVIQRIDERLVRETTAEVAAIIMKATLSLTGLRLTKNELKELRKGARSMDVLRESSAYELFLDEGMIHEARKLVLRLGQARFGPLGEETRKAIEAIEELEPLERLLDRLLFVSNWSELLAEPQA
jgi:hypothetical protein